MNRSFFKKFQPVPGKVLIGLLMLLWVCTLSAQITILESNSQQLTFAWNLGSIDTVTVTDGNSRAMSLSFAGSTISLGNDGEPILPASAFFVGIPRSGEIRATLTPVATRRIRLSCPPAVWKSGTFAPRNSTIPSTDAWITPAEYTSFRSQRAARLVIQPIRYDEASQSVVVLSQGTGTITFPPATNRPYAGSLTGDYERMLRTLLLNYKVASGWRLALPAAKKRSMPYPITSDRKLYSFRIGDGHSGLNEATIHENGILKIPGSRILSLFGSVPIGQVRLYGASKGMLPESLPDDSTFADGVAEVPLMRIDRNSNGMVDSNDVFLAYVTGASDWVADPANSGYRFVIDWYDDYRTYWLGTGTGEGQTIRKVAKTLTAADHRKSMFMEWRQYRQSLIRHDNNPGNRKWLWRILSARQPSFEQQLAFPGFKPGDTAWLKFEGLNTYGSPTFAVRLGKTSLCDTCYSTSSLYPITQPGDSLLRLDYNPGADSKDARLELECFNVKYPRQLAVGDAPVVFTVLPDDADTGVVTSFEMSVTTRQKVYIFKISENESTVALVDTVTPTANGIVGWIDSAGYSARYVICNDSALKQLPEVTEAPRLSNSGVEIRDLRSANNIADYLIITHPDFIAAADSLARHKKTVGFKNPAVVDVNNIYRFFSGGDKDVAAIRNFIGYARRYWRDGENLDYALLMGTGHYDTKNLASQAPDFIPVYLNGDENEEGFFGITLFGSRDAQLAIGRLPCTSADQAWAMVTKIIEYEDPSAADFGEWRNRAVFVADDDMQGDKVDQVAISTPHHESSDRTVAIIDSLWPSMDLRKVYLYEYEWDQAKQKPGASRALINEINNGAAYINFFGHGADITWTDEYILTQEMVAGMANDKRYPVVTAFSCSVGRFDKPGEECLSGVLAKTPGVGSIASISSTREAYANANESLAKSYFRCLFDSAASRSIGLAFIAGQALNMGDGHRTYCILGDPSVRAVRADRTVSLSIDDADDTVSALQMLTISGSILDNNGRVDQSFGSGTWVSIGLFNAPDSATRKDNGERAVRYSLPGAPMFLGKTALSAGTFRQTILVPQNLSFDKNGVKLTAYAWKDHSTAAAVGYRGSVIFHGSQTGTASGDTSGPRITIRPAYDNERLSGGSAAYTDRVTTQVPAKFEIELFDESGIDAAGLGPDEGVTLELEGVFSRRNVNSKFQFKEGDFRRGAVSVFYEEDAVKPGTYTLALTARDLLGNLSKVRFSLVVTAWDELRLDHVLNFPNPVRMGSTTRFYLSSNYTSQQYYGADIRFVIRIYTLGGRLIRVLRNVRNGEVWDCRDQRGELLGPDIYLYQVTAEDVAQRKTVKSRIMKLAVLPPR